MKTQLLNHACFACKHVYNKERDVCIFISSEDDFQTICGIADHCWDKDENIFEPDEAYYTHLAHLVDYDETILEIIDIPIGYTATRNFRGDPWIIKKDE